MVWFCGTQLSLSTEGFVPGIASYLVLGKNISTVYLHVFVSLLKLPLMFAITVLFCIFANGTVWSTSALLWLWYCWTGFDWFGSWGSTLTTYYRWLRIHCGGSGSVVGRGNWPIFPQFKKIARHFPGLGPRSTSMDRGIF